MDHTHFFPSQLFPSHPRPSVLSSLIPTFLSGFWSHAYYKPSQRYEGLRHFAVPKVATEEVEVESVAVAEVEVSVEVDVKVPPAAVVQAPRRLQYQGEVCLDPTTTRCARCKAARYWLIIKIIAGYLMDCKKIQCYIYYTTSNS